MVESVNGQINWWLTAHAPFLFGIIWPYSSFMLKNGTSSKCVELEVWSWQTCPTSLLSYPFQSKLYQSFPPMTSVNTSMFFQVYHLFTMAFWQTSLISVQISSQCQAGSHTWLLPIFFWDKSWSKNKQKKSLGFNRLLNCFNTFLCLHSLQHLLLLDSQTSPL